MEATYQEPLHLSPKPDAIATLVEVLRGRRAELVGEGVRQMFEEIPAYARVAGDAFANEVHEHVGLHHDAIVRSMALGRSLQREEMGFIRPCATRRVTQVPLASFMHAFRVYPEVLWEAILERVDGEDAKEAALVSGGILIRYVNVAQAEAAAVFLEVERLHSAQGEGLRRDLVEDLLAGRPPAPGAKLSAVREVGLADGARVIVVAAALIGESGDDHRARAAASAISRAFGSVIEPLTVVRQREVVCIAPAHGDLRRVAAALTAAQERLAREGTVLAVGISSVAQAYLDAAAAVERMRVAGGVLAMSSLTAFDCLMMFGQDCARRSVSAPVRQLVAEDVANGGHLVETALAYAAADFNIKVLSARLFIHPNTARYRLKKIAERTHLDLRCFADVQELVIGIRLEEAAAGD
jgi:hypothetical protein